MCFNLMVQVAKGLKPFCLCVALGLVFFWGTPLSAQNNLTQPASASETPRAGGTPVQTPPMPSSSNSNDSPLMKYQPPAPEVNVFQGVSGGAQNSHRPMYNDSGAALDADSIDDPEDAKAIRQ